MRLNLNGKINSLYVQSLCMMFFRGEKFPINEDNPRGELTVIANDEKEGIRCYVKLIYDGKTATSEHFEGYNSFDKYERTSKACIGRAIFEACTNLTGYVPPWGLLTGIRPSVVAGELIEKYGQEMAYSILKEKYILSNEKAKLAIQVAINERNILNKYDNSSCSIYISIPFCPTRCTYCSFISYATDKLFKLIPDYVDKIIEQLRDTFELINYLGLKVVTVYIGGGTPTTLSDKQLERVLSAIDKFLNRSSLVEFTVEGGRPDTITKEKLFVIKKYGVNRISVNPQSLNDEVLKNIGTRHTSADFLNSYKLVKESEISIINTDLIAGLDGDSFESFKYTLDKIVDLAPDNITVHSFSVKKSAQALQNDRDIYNLDGEIAIKSVEYSYKTLIDNGYIPYYMYRQKNTISDLENVGYAKVDAIGAYNVLMMSDEHTVFGIGAGATTKLVRKKGVNREILRIFSHKYPYEYLQDNQNVKSKIIEFFEGRSNDENN